MNCPNCSDNMELLEFQGVSGTTVAIDLCFPCHTMWLDKRESIHLSPRGTLELFRRLHEHHEDARHALEGRQGCPRCGRRLSLHQDMAKGTRFSYYACPDGHGRLTPFSEFLKEKQFVRSLNPGELSRVRAELRQVQCSACGAPVDIQKELACGHCRSPVAVLDADAVEKTLRGLHKADSVPRLDPEFAEMEARAMAAMEQLRAGPEARWNRVEQKKVRVTSRGVEIDLVSAAFGVIGSVLDVLD